MGLLQFFLERDQRRLEREEREDRETRENEEGILQKIRQKDFSSLGIEMDLIEEVFYKALEAGIIKIVASDDGTIKISISNMELETFPIKIERHKLNEFFYID